MKDYLCVVENKNRKVINKTKYNGELDSAKRLLNILVYQTGVRYGYLLESSKDKRGNISYKNKVYDTVIIHEGE